MTTLFKNANVYYQDKFIKADLAIKDGVVVDINDSILQSKDTEVVNCSDKYIIPGLADVHVHLREPGFLYKETIKTGTLAGAKGGFTLLCSMPNTNPVPDTVDNINLQLKPINDDAQITVLPYASITIEEKGEELVDFNSLKDLCFAFSDDGKGVQSEEMMKEAMLKAKAVNKAIVAHCEDESLLTGGYIHEGEYAKKHSHKGISSASEYSQAIRDINLVRQTGVQYHICHVSTKETVAAVRQAKKDGLRVSCETAPHYIAFCDEDLQEDGRFKMNPPIRSKEDRQALIQGIKDGTIEVIATDHAPHSLEEKSKGLEGSAMGVVGLETAFSAIYTHLVKTNEISLEHLVKLMSINPREIFGLEAGIQIGKKADFILVDLDYEYTVNPKEFLTKGRATPFEGNTLYGQILLTYAKGEKVWQDNTTKK